MMRYLFPLTLVAMVLLLCGCPAPKGPESKEFSKPLNSPAAPAEEPAAAGVDSFVGAWAASDEQGQPFDLVLFPNGQAVTTWVKGASGARGERGFWRAVNGGATVFFDDGWTDRLIVRDGQVFHQGFAPDAAVGAPPRNESPANRILGPTMPFVGVWRLNKELDGNYLYVALQSGGRAFSMIDGGTEGKWEMTDAGALCTWPDGWNDLIYGSPTGYQKRSWVGPASNATPPDISPASRVGEERFAITP